jgi:hypothetical protein
MRKIKYKKTISDNYQIYVDIGACEKHYDFLPLYKEELISYNDWYFDFLKYPLGVQMLSIHYYLLQFNSESYVPEIINKKFLENKDFLNEFNRTWFEEDVPFFKGLDLNWEDINEEIAETVENENGIISEVNFKNGSSLYFLDEDDTIQSFYVKEKEHENLKKEFDKILVKLK